MFVGGFATFAMLYATQPLLPLLSTEFSVSPASASLSVSAGTATLALMLIPASVLADRFGRVKVMRISLALAALIALACAAVSDFAQLLILRALLGASLAGLPAAAMAYIGEEVSPRSQGKAMGLYIAGNALGGMSGRVISAILTDFGSWRTALFVLGLLGIASAAAFWMKLPTSQHFRARSASLSRIMDDARYIASDAGLRWLFATALLAMGVFIGVYNYLGFRLLEAPFELSQSAVGAIFLIYVVGSWASATAGQLTDRHGRRRIQWIAVMIMIGGLALTLSNALPVLVIGVTVFTFGFFATHSISSGWVARRAQERRGLATAIYLTAYYIGASLIGSMSGFAWILGRWNGIVSGLGVCLLLLLVVVLRLRKLPSEAA